MNLARPFRVCRRKELCGSPCDLCASVVKVLLSHFTTETQRSTEFAQRNPFFRLTLQGREDQRARSRRVATPKTRAGFNRRYATRTGVNVIPGVETPG